MRAVVAYESMFGNTHHVAEAIADDISEVMPATVTSVSATTTLLEGVDVIVVGVPTHVHGMPLARTRDGAKQMSAESDTRTELPRVFTGAASGRIDHALRECGFRVVTAPTSFLIDTSNHLEPSELGRARGWRIDLAHESMSIHAADATESRRYETMHHPIAPKRYK